MLRLIGFLFVAFGVVIAGTDWIATGSSLAAFRFREIGVVWSAFDRSSLDGLRPAVESVSAGLWPAVVEPALFLPAAPVVIVVGLLFFLLGLRGQQRRRYR